MRDFRTSIGYFCTINQRIGKKMKYFKSYPYQQEDIEQLPVKVIEDILIRISNDPLLDWQEREELSWIYVKERWQKKQENFVYSPENVQRIAEMNELLIRQVTEVVTTAFEIREQEIEECRRQGKKCKVKVAPRLMVPNCMYGWIRNEKNLFTEREAKVWGILASPYDGKAKDARSIMPNAAEFSPWKEGKGFSQHLEDLLWGPLACEEPDLRSWGDEMTIDYEKTKHIVFCWPFQNFLEHQRFSMEDILKIDKFNMEIKLSYEIH